MGKEKCSSCPRFCKFERTIQNVQKYAGLQNGKVIEFLNENKFSFDREQCPRRSDIEGYLNGDWENLDVYYSEQKRQKQEKRLSID